MSFSPQSQKTGVYSCQLRHLSLLGTRCGETHRALRLWIGGFAADAGQTSRTRVPLSTAALALSLLLGLDRCFGLGLDVWLHLLCADGGYVVGTYRSRGIRTHARLGSTCGTARCCPSQPRHDLLTNYDLLADPLPRQTSMRARSTARRNLQQGLAAGCRD